MVIAKALEDNMTKVFPLLVLLLLPLSVSAELYIMIIQGLAGSPAYEQQFNEQVARLESAAETVTDRDRIRVISGPAATRDNLLSHFDQLAGVLDSADRVAVFMVGHGSYDGYEYKFMIPGPDITDDDLVDIMDALPATTQLLVNTGSASGALLEPLRADGRILITATRSGNERLATRFGIYFADAFSDPAADINKNNAISAREAFDYAERQVRDYFEYQGQLATEHPVLEGDLAAQFVLARSGSVQPQLDDPQMAGLLRERDEIDRRIEDLQFRRNDMDTEDYLDQLQGLMIELSITQGQIDDLTGGLE